MPDPLTPDAVNALVARLSDDEVRQLLLTQLNAAVPAQAAEEPGVRTIFSTLANAWVAFYTPILEAIQRLPLLFSKQFQAFADFGKSFGALGLLELFGFMFIAVAAGLAGEKALNFFTRKWQGAELAAGDETLRSALSFLFRRFCREILGLIAFYFVTRTVALGLMSSEQIAFAAPFLTYLVWLPRITAAVSRFVLSPDHSELRLVNISDKWAKYLCRNLVGLVLLGGFTIYIIKFNVIHGIQMGETRIGFWLNLMVHIYVGVIAWRARDGLVQMMRGKDPDRTEFEEVVARAYPAFAVAVAGLTWVAVTVLSGMGQFRLLLTSPHFKTMFWLLMAPAIDTLIRGLVRHLQPPMTGEGPVAEAAYRSTRRSYIRIGRILALAFVVLTIASAWGIDFIDMVNSKRDTLSTHLIAFVLVLAVGYVLFELMSLWVNRRLAREQTSISVSEEEHGSEGGGGGRSRLATVLPLVLIAAQVAIAVIFGLLALGSLGIDTTPLLAGAGILGLAIGFGAQKLVADVVSGIFFLLDDAFRVGEYVEVGGTMGTVEKISVRSMQLRHHRGLVHTIPYGEIPKLTNFSRDWVIMKLKFTVPFDTDPNVVKKIFKKIGAEMMAEPEFKDDFIEPFKSQGVLDFDDVGMVVRGKFMAKPGTQFTIRKELFNRVKREFEAAGIDFARREVRVAVPGLDKAEHMTPEQRSGITAAAADAVRKQIEDEQAEGKS